MKREILFRGKRVDNNEWVYDNLIIEHDGTYFIDFWVSELIEPENNYYEMVNKHFEVISETVGQFTGLPDKNGVKIFEGDIISDGFENAEIKWFNDECQFLAEFKNELNDPQELGNWGIIIGNIYDNPEFLK